MKARLKTLICLIGGLFLLETQAQVFTVCPGEEIFLSAIQTFPQGPAGPDGTSCTPFLTDISISPTTNAVAVGTTGFMITANESAIYTVTSNGFAGAPGIGSCSDQAEQSYTIVVDVSVCSNVVNICQGESVDLPAIQTFPTGPAGPDGTSCTPFLNGIFIAPTTNAVANGLASFTVSPTVTTTYTVTSTGFTGAPGIGSCSDEASTVFTVVVDNCGNTENICLGGSAFLPAIQNFPTGPAGPDGTSCTPFLTDISISPSTDAFKLDTDGFYVYPTETTTYTVTSNGFAGAPGIGSCSDVIEETFTVNVDDLCQGVTFSVFFANVFLEGAYNANTGSMDANLNNLTPLTQPFDGDPYFYDGDESFDAIPDNAVDWVLLEMRIGTPSLSNPNTTTVERQACLLLENGQLLDTDGFLGIVFSKLAANQGYHVVIRHRNHLDVITNTSILASSNMVHDFTTSSTQAFGPEQLKEMSTGIYALYAGDYTADGIIQSTDVDLWSLQPAINNTYGITDGNMDGVVQATDYDIWFANKAKVGAAEIQLD